MIDYIIEAISMSCELANHLSISIIIIAGLPLFWKHPQNQFISDSVKVIFDCFSNGSDSLTITWEKDRRSYTSGVTRATAHSNGV